jgi:alternate signal-mediated exported protein
MNKLVTGAVAGAAGIALLLGGAGTFALWNASTEVNASSVASGTLSLTQSSAGSWTDVTNGRSTALTTAQVAAYKVVPGSKLQFTQPITIVASGTDLRADLTYDATSVTGSLKPYVTNALTVSTAAGSSTLPSGVTAGSTAGSYVVAPVAAGSTSAVVTFVVELPSTVTDAASQGGTLDLSKLTFTLKQRAIA